MKFKCNTKPIKDLVDLLVLNENISNYFERSTLLQISVNGTGICLNTEADCVVSQGVLKGKVEDPQENVVVFVRAAQFKSLINTLDSATIDIEFQEDSVTIYSGKSKFDIPAIGMDEDATLTAPTSPKGDECELKHELWKSVKDRQMYALCEDFVSEVYTYVFNGPKEIIVGDYMNSIFTMQEKSGFPSQCLLSTSIIRVILNVDPKTKVYHMDRSFILVNNNDAYDFICELKPRYETEETLASYNSEAIIQLFSNAKSYGIAIPAAKVKVVLNQCILLLSDDYDVVNIICNGNKIQFKSRNVDSIIEGKTIGDGADGWDAQFKVKDLYKIISNVSGEDVIIYPAYRDDELTGCIFNDKEVSAILGCNDSE